MNSDRRHPLRPFNPEQLKNFLGEKKIVSAVLMPIGKSNSNYKIKTSDGKKFVLRLYNNRANPAKEALIMDLVKEIIPVPKLLYRENDYAVWSFLPGIPLNDAPQEVDKAAEILAGISRISFDQPGEIHKDGTITSWNFDGNTSFFEFILKDSTVREYLGSDRIKQIQKILKANSSRLAEMNAESKLVHGDFNPGNILVHNGKISGILDWEFAMSGTPFMDIGNLLRNTDKKYHEKAYQGLVKGGIKLPNDWKTRADLVDLGSHLEFLSSNCSEDFKQSRLRLIDDFIETVKSIN
jgi:aminoglycoside phosphotransferase (APT) family kinase protein